MAIRTLLGALGAVTLLSSAAFAQGYPERQITMIVPFSAGGPAELVARLTGQKLAEQLGQQFIVDARGGGGGTIGVEIVSKAAPDGYTLLLHTVGHVITPALYRKLPYDATKDFAPIALAYPSQLMMIVHPSVPVKTVKDLIGLARAKPNQINYASSGNGGISHLAVHLFQTMAGIQFLQRPGVAMTKAQLEDRLYAFGDEVESNTIEVHVSRLRKKLGHPVIDTVRGIGYRLGSAR